MVKAYTSIALPLIMLILGACCNENKKASEVVDCIKSRRDIRMYKDNPIPREDIKNWLDTMKKNGVKMMIVSNNKPHRVQPFSDVLKFLKLDFQNPL